MKVLLAVNNPALLDQLRVGLRAFGDLSVECATGVAIFDLVRRVDYGFMILEIEHVTREEIEPLEKLHLASPDLEVLVAGSEPVIHHLKEDRLRGKVYGFLRTPLDAVEFFRAVSRLRQHLETSAPR